MSGSAKRRGIYERAVEQVFYFLILYHESHRAACGYFPYLPAAFIRQRICPHFLFDRERPLEYLCGGCLVLSLFLPELALFLPLFFYDCERSGKWYLRFAWVPLYLYHFHNFTLPAFFLFLFTGVLALYLSRLTMEYEI